MTNTNLVDNFNRSKMEFLKTQPPAGQLVCRMNLATLKRLFGELDAAGGSEIGWDSAAVYAMPTFCGAITAIDASQADGEFAFSVRMPGLTGHEFAGWMPADCSTAGTA